MTDERPRGSFNSGKQTRHARGGLRRSKLRLYPIINRKIRPMKLTINGESRVVPADNLKALVEQLGMKPDRVAIELNREIVAREQWLTTPLKDGDQLEIVHFVGGGSAAFRTKLEA